MRDNHPDNETDKAILEQWARDTHRGNDTQRIAKSLGSIWKAKASDSHEVPAEKESG